MPKSTSKILEELQGCKSFADFYETNNENMVNRSLSDFLGEMLAKKGLKKSQVIKNSEMSEVYAYQIFDGKKRPDRKKLICLAFGMEMNLDEVQEMLAVSGYPRLYAKNGFDCIIIYSIINNFSVIKANEMLYEYGFETIG